MITREMIRNGFESGTVSIEEEYAGCIGICCRIGDNAFYFLGSEDNDLTKEEVANLEAQLNEVIIQLAKIK